MQLSYERRPGFFYLEAMRSGYVPHEDRPRTLHVLRLGPARLALWLPFGTYRAALGLERHLLRIQLGTLILSLPLLPEN